MTIGFLLCPTIRRQRLWLKDTSYEHKNMPPNVMSQFHNVLIHLRKTPPRHQPPPNFRKCNIYKISIPFRTSPKNVGSEQLHSALFKHLNAKMAQRGFKNALGPQIKDSRNALAPQIVASRQPFEPRSSRGSRKNIIFAGSNNTIVAESDNLRGQWYSFHGHECCARWQKYTARGQKL